MMHPATRLAFVNESVGLGVVAQEHIPAGTLVWVRDPLDQVVDRPKLDVLSNLQRDALWTHAWGEGDRWYLTWDHGRYTNHSCEPNCAGLDGEFDLAIRDIEPGEQITDDYGTFEMRVRFHCSCGAPRCRGEVGADPFARPSPGLRRDYRLALRRSRGVEQPLLPLMQQLPGRGFELFRQRAS